LYSGRTRRVFFSRIPLNRATASENLRSYKD
jgi:hypothetical protein